MTLKDLKQKCEDLRRQHADDNYYVMFRLADVEDVIREVETGVVKGDAKEESEVIKQTEVEPAAEATKAAPEEEKPAEETEPEAKPDQPASKPIWDTAAKNSQNKQFRK